MNLLHSSYCRVVVSYDDVVVGIRGIEPCLKMGVQSHGMRACPYNQTSIQG